MKQVGAEKYPERWSEIFDAAMAEYDAQGCYLADPAYFDQLQETYHCMEPNLELYKKAAAQTAEDEALGRYLTLLAMALRDKESHANDIPQVGLLKVPEGKEPLAYNMVTGLGVCSQLDAGNATMLARKVPEEWRFDCLKSAANGGVGFYQRTHDGEPGFSLLGWAQHYLNAKMFMIERLEVEFDCKFWGKATVYENAAGEQIALANDIVLHRSGFALGSKHFEDEEGSFEAFIEETEDSFVGYPYKENGYVATEKIALSKKEWKAVITNGDPVIGIHIPNRSKGPLTPEAVDKTLAAIREFAAVSFPDYPYKAFTCHSWLMDPQLNDLVGAESNIGKFTNRYRKMTGKSQGEAVFNFIFNMPNMDFKMEDLPENTRLEKSLKEHYLSGKAIYEMFGYFM